VLVVTESSVCLDKNVRSIARKIEKKCDEVCSLKIFSRALETHLFLYLMVRARLRQFSTTGSSDLLRVNLCVNSSNPLHVPLLCTVFTPVGWNKGDNMDVAIHRKIKKMMSATHAS
jgi:hypothetical protein